MADHKLKIECFLPADEDAVVALWERCFAGHLTGHNEPRGSIARKMAAQPELFFVAKLSGVIVGTTMAGYDGHRGWLYSVAVDPDTRRHGVGRQLLQHTEAALRAMGCPKINLQVRASNAGVIAFYEHCGYAVEENVSMGKTIAGSAVKTPKT